MSAIINHKRYPFLKPLEDELKRYPGITLNDLLSINTYYLKTAMDRINKVLNNEELEPYEKIKDPFLVFYTTLYLIIALDNELLKKKFIEKETELFEKSLMDESEDVLLKISKFFNIHINQDILPIKYKQRKLHQMMFRFSMSFIDYLKETKWIRKEDESFSLSARILKDGKVFLTKQDVVKIISYKVKDYLYEALNIKLDVVPEEIRKIAEEFKGKRTPPCIQSLMKKKELNETEKTVLITYFIDTGDYEKMKRFSEDLIKKYQGDRKTKYIIYPCNKMKELGLCVASCNVLNPLQLYYGKNERLILQSGDNKVY